MYKYSNNSLDRYIGSPKYQWEINNISYKCDQNVKIRFIGLEHFN